MTMAIVPTTMGIVTVGITTIDVMAVITADAMVTGAITGIVMAITIIIGAITAIITGTIDGKYGVPCSRSDRGAVAPGHDFCHLSVLAPGRYRLSLV